MSDHYVACLDLTGRACLVVGAGKMAQEKVDGLEEAGAVVTLVAPHAYSASDLDGIWLVVAATSHDELNRGVYADASERRIFCNVADVPELCSFILPALHRRGPITVRGLARVRACEVLVYDRLVAPELVAEAPAEALRIARDSISQDDVNALLVVHGRRHRVVRLKGGDPFVFGRGGEEALALAEAGVPFEVVPGVSSLSAVPAAVGIPVTHRGVSSQVTIANAQGPLDFAALARTEGTLVLFMG